MASSKTKTINIRKSILLSTTALTLVGGLAFAGVAQAADLELPTGEQVVRGGAEFKRKAAQGTLKITQNSKRLIVDWDSFNIGKDAEVKFKQVQGRDSIAVNRVTGTGIDPTKIRGKLSANGNLIILDPNGVIFGRNSQVDVGGLIASTGKLHNENAFMRGDEQFVISDTDQNGDKTVVNRGNITVKNNGLLAFVAPYAKNNGTINATFGKVTLAAGETATVDLTGDALVSLAVGKKLSKALAQNKGTINAAGGTVAMTANAAKDVVDNVINMEGVINASSFKNKGGKIILDGGAFGKVNVSGQAKAHTNSKQKGSIEIGGRDITIEETAYITTNGVDGGGDINIGTGDNSFEAVSVDVQEGSIIDASSLLTGDAGNISVWARLSTLFSGFASARGGLLGGDAGSVYIGTKGNRLGFSGTVVMVAPSGAAGELTLQANRLNLVADGKANAPATLGEYVVRADKLAEVLTNSNVILTGGSGVYTFGDKKIDFRSYLTVPNLGLSTQLSQNGDLTINSPLFRVNRGGDVIMGESFLTLNTNQVDLNGKIYGSNETTMIGKDQFSSTTGLVNILSSFASIQQGIDLINDEVNVDPAVNVNFGRYVENLIIDKEITLTGIGRDEARPAPILEAADTNTPVVKVKVSNVTFDNFDVRAGEGTDERLAVRTVFAAPSKQIGLKAKGVSNTVVKNSTFTGFDVGVKAKETDTFELTGNTFVENEIGFKSKDSMNIYADWNTFSGTGLYSYNTYGIKARGGMNVFATNNTFSDLETGAFFGGIENRVRASDNTFENVYTGIRGQNLDKFRVVKNIMSGVYYGIEAEKISEILRIRGNKLNVPGEGAGVGFTGYEGIYVYDADDAVIKNNTVRYFSNEGILVEFSDNVSFEKNWVAYISDGNGYTLFHSDDATFYDNKAFFTNWSGFSLINSKNAYLENNLSFLSGFNGFSVLGSNRATLINNYAIGGGQMLFGSRPSQPQGLVQASVMMDCMGNCPGDFPPMGLENGFQGNGILVANSRGVRLEENTLIGSRNDGIHVEDYFGRGYGQETFTAFSGYPMMQHPGMYDLQYVNPYVSSNNFRAIRNVSFISGDDGIDLTGINNARVRGNRIYFADGNGIEAEGIFGSRINRNRIFTPGRDGISVSYGSELEVNKNRIFGSRIPGEEPEGDQIDLVQVKSQMVGFPFYQQDGISLMNIDNVEANENIIKNFDNGISIDGVDVASFAQNQLSENGYGFAAQGPFNGDFTLADNIFTDNETGALFGSGNITLEGVNQFIGGQTGMIFSPSFGKEKPSDGLEFVVFDDAPREREPVGQLTLVGNTLGTTSFEGQEGNYVELHNGALFNPGTPTVINAINASFDGVSGPELTQAQLNAIEAKLVDFDDNGTTGDIFAGFVPSTLTVAEEDVLREILAILGITGGDAGVIISGLPNIPGLGQSLVEVLNALQPAAGGETPEDLDNLEPAAGGTQVACWGQLGAGSGAVTYTLGETAANILADMAECSVVQ